MECKMCQKVFDNLERRAMVLECGHSFCKICMLSLFDMNPSICPIDKAYISQNINSLKVNYGLEEIIQVLASLNILIPRDSFKSIDTNEHVEKNILDQESKTKCPKQHDLIYFSKIKYRNKVSDNPKSTIINCDLCKRRKLKSSWSCIECDYDICKKCLPLSIEDQEDYKLYIEEQINLEISNIPQMKCSNNHQLVHWKNIKDRIIAGDLPYDTNIKCDFCNFNKLKSSWSCIDCKFDLCYDCSEDQKNSKLSIKNKYKVCKKSHPLYFYESNNLFYKKKLGVVTSIFCAFCNKNWTGGSWGCRRCNYDLCQECVNKVLKCDKGHALTGNGQKAMKTCSICSNYGDYSYKCLTCGYFVCSHCVNYVENKVSVNLNCPLGHSLFYPKDLKLYLIYSGRNKFRCDACEVLFTNSKSYFCKYCNFDLCDSCFDTINQGIRNGIKRLCRKGHKLHWYNDIIQYYSREYRCNICREFRGSGSFHCRFCEYDVCVKCSKS